MNRYSRKSKKSANKFSLNTTDVQGYLLIQGNALFFLNDIMQKQAPQDPWMSKEAPYDLINSPIIAYYDSITSLIPSIYILYY